MFDCLKKRKRDTLPRGGQRIAVTNRSQSLTDGDVASMTAAVATQLRDHVAPAWRIAVPNAGYTSGSVKTEPRGAWVLAVVDSQERARALGWHTSGDGERVFGVVDVLACNEAGFPVSAVLSHEAIEAALDPWCNRFASDHQNTLWALEPADPVQADTYDVEGWPMSNWVTADWFNAYGTGPFDHMRKLARPFQLADGGYAIVVNHAGRRVRYGADKLYDAKGGLSSRGDRLTDAAG